MSEAAIQDTEEYYFLCFKDKKTYFYVMCLMASIQDTKAYLFFILFYFIKNKKTYFLCYV